MFGNEINLRKEFPKNVIEQAQNAKRIRTYSYISRRSDLRGKTVFSFTENYSSPAEHAFSLYPSGCGWQLGVHIADVCEYVPEGSPIDIEARNRRASIFNGFESTEMLPDQLCKDLCDLSGKDDKLTISVFLDISPKGELKNISFEESVIANNENCIYSEIDELRLASDTSAVLSLRNKYADYIEAIDDMYSLAAIFCSKRLERKGLDCANVTRVYERDETGKITSYKMVTEADCRAMVREIGYFVSEAIGEYMHKRKLPCIYNGRSSVPKGTLDYLSDLVGLKTKEKDSAKRAAMVAEAAKGTEYYSFVCNALASSLPAGEFSVKPINNAFCGTDRIVSLFTPASKYTNLLMQRILKHIIAAKGETTNLNLNRMKKLVASAAEEANKAEAYIRETQMRFRIESALEYIENSGLEFQKGFPLFVEENGAVPVVLECGLMSIVPSEYAKGFEFEPAKVHDFQVIALGTLDELTILKPVI